MSNQPPNDGSPSRNRHRDKSGTSTGPRFRKNTGGNTGPNNSTTSNGTAAASPSTGSPVPSHQHIHYQQTQRTQSPRVSHASIPPPRMAQPGSVHGSPAPTFVHPHALHTHSPHPIHAAMLGHRGQQSNVSHMGVIQTHSPLPHPPNLVHSHSQPISHPSNMTHAHSPNIPHIQSPNIAQSHSPNFHAHGHSPSLHASTHYPPHPGTPTYSQHSHPQYMYPSPSPRPRPMSMHAGVGMGMGVGAVAMGSLPGTPTIAYGMGAPVGMGMQMHTGVNAYESPTMHLEVSNMGAQSVNHPTNTNHTPASSQPDQSTAFNLCRRRVVAPTLDGQPAAYASAVDPELAGIAMRVVSPQPVLLPNGFLWEFEIPRGMVPTSLTSGILNVSGTAIPLLLESQPADACARGEHTARIYMPQQCLETHTGWEEKRAEWIAERTEQYPWRGRIPDVANSYISTPNRTGKPVTMWVCKSRFPDLSQRSENEVMVIARTVVQGGSEEWAQMACRRAMPPLRTILPQGESQLKMWILRALSTLVLQGVEVVEWSYEFLVSEQQFWWVYRGRGQSGGDPDLFGLDRGEPIPDDA
ncbi:hypothetical protein V565_019920 [Rhizoctonia solani 123E]|uniref:Uncharacterized protein n=1 Tax=Rhizoctonia solani 123E TaxID=1423351 RepID=A0A074S4J7_9AGAM|nr:hypothetical protein V565_019920 [Rhizoctonia solani 123E]